jgi:hypothetical protein
VSWNGPRGDGCAIGLGWAVRYRKKNKKLIAQLAAGPAPAPAPAAGGAAKKKKKKKKKKAKAAAEDSEAAELGEAAAPAPTPSKKKAKKKKGGGGGGGGGPVPQVCLVWGGACAMGRGAIRGGAASFRVLDWSAVLAIRQRLSAALVSTAPQ